MTRIIHNGFGIILVAFVLTACVTSKNTSSPASNIPQDGSLLTQAQAVRIAKQTFKQRGFLLKDFKEPCTDQEIHYGYRAEYIYWHVTFESKLPEFPIPYSDNKFVDVKVDDQTHLATLEQIHPKPANVDLTPDTLSTYLINAWSFSYWR